MTGEDTSRSRQGAPPRAGQPVDGLLLAAVLGLAAVGAVMVYSASAIPAGQSRRLGYDEFYYLKRQLVAAGIGLALLAAALRIGHRRIVGLAYPVLGLTLAVLALVPFVGKTAGGAQRWIPLGPVQFQPAEAAKVVLVLYLAHSLARKQQKVRLFSIGVLPHLLVTGLFVLLCLVQRDLGTGVILFLVLLAMLFAAGARIGYLLLAAVLALPVAWHLVKSTPYRWARVMSFLDPGSLPLRARVPALGVAPRHRERRLLRPGARAGEGEALLPPRRAHRLHRGGDRGGGGAARDAPPPHALRDRGVAGAPRRAQRVRIPSGATPRSGSRRSSARRRS